MSFPLLQQISVNQSTATTETKPLVLREGQLFHGQVKQLYPGDMAEIQVGHQKLMAKLEVPMKAGDQYYFQVQKTEPELQLKIITGPLQSTDSQKTQLSRLLTTLQLPKTEEMVQLVMRFMKSKAPVSKEQLIQAEKQLKTVPVHMRAAAFVAIDKLVELKLPITDQHFRALMGVVGKEGLHSILASLEQTIQAETGISDASKQGILNSLKATTQPLKHAQMNVLLNELLIRSLDKNQSVDMRFNSLQVMKNAQLVPAHTSLANLSTVVHSLLLESQLSAHPSLTSPAEKTNGQPVASQSIIEQWGTLARLLQGGDKVDQIAQQVRQFRQQIQVEPSLDKNQKRSLMQQLQQVEKAWNDSSNLLAKSVEMSQMVLRISAENGLKMPFSAQQSTTALFMPHQENTFHLLQSIERSPMLEIRQLLSQSEAKVTQQIDGAVMKRVIQQVIHSLGLNYEASLQSNEVQGAALKQLLKPQLVSLLTEATISPQLRDVAELTIARLNGPFMQSGETSHQHQLVMQLPLEFFGKKIDATLQWNGRLDENDQLDTDYARILFYLQLESLQQTVMDMHVQNRVVTLTIYNDHAHKLQQLSTNQIDQLKTNLTDLNYHLSSIQFKDFQEGEQQKMQQKTPIQNEGGGVDVRV